MKVRITKIGEAMLFAINAHEGQKRWDGSPYISHPEQVQKILMNWGIEDEDILCASLLHDVVEDTKIPLNEIQKEFGFKVGDYVSELTNPAHSPQYLEKMRYLSEGATIIKIADLIHNLSDMKGDKRSIPKRKEALIKRMKALNILTRRMIEFEQDTNKKT